MEPFTVLHKRGHMMEEAGAADMRRRMYPEENVSAAGPTPTPRAGGRKISARDLRSPQDLMRSRRSGLSRVVCSMCLRPDREGVMTHTGWCPVIEELQAAAAGHGLPIRDRQTTGPMSPNETSKDVGWR